MTDPNRFISLTINNRHWEGEVNPNLTLLDFVRETLELTGSKKGCDEGACGACAILVDGEAICSCLALAVETDGRKIITIEGLSTGGQPSQIQRAFVEKDALQCGFCTSGQIVAATSFLNNNINPDPEDVIDGMSGNLCRCGCYKRISEAILETAGGKGGR